MDGFLFEESRRCFLLRVFQNERCSLRPGEHTSRSQVSPAPLRGREVPNCPHSLGPKSGATSRGSSSENQRARGAGPELGGRCRARVEHVGRPTAQTPGKTRPLRGTSVRPASRETRRGGGEAGGGKAWGVKPLIHTACLPASPSLQRVELSLYVTS